MTMCVRVVYPWVAPGRFMGRRQVGKCDALGQCSGSCGYYFDMYDLPKHCYGPGTQPDINSIPWWPHCSAKSWALPHCKNCVEGFELMVLIWLPHSPDLNSIEHLWDVRGKSVQSLETPPHNLYDLLLTSWARCHKNTFRGLVDVSTFLAAPAS